MIIRKNISFFLILLLAAPFYKTYASFIEPTTMSPTIFPKIIIGACSFAGALFSWNAYKKWFLKEQANTFPLIKTEKQIITFSGSEIELETDKYGNPLFCFTTLTPPHTQKEQFLTLNNID